LVSWKRGTMQRQKILCMEMPSSVNDNLSIKNN
jgi:hypothetical protein